MTTIQLGTLSRIEWVGINITLCLIVMGFVASPALGGWKIQRLYRNISEHIFHLCNPCSIRKRCSNLVVESRDEILFKGGRLWRPRFSAALTALTLDKRRSTWAITSKTRPTALMTLLSTLVKPYSKPLEHPFSLQCQPELLPRSPNFT
jgi:hypothetical protein